MAWITEHYINLQTAENMMSVRIFPVAVFCVMSCSVSAAPVEFFDQSAFDAAVNDEVVVGFDNIATQAVLDGTEFPGITITSRRITAVSPVDFAPGLAVGGANVNSQPNGISASLAYSTGGSITFDNGDDDFSFVFDEPMRAAGLWVGNLGASSSDPTTATTVQFFDVDGTLLASSALTQATPGLVGSGANNRIFYGVLTHAGIGSFTVSNEAFDGDGIILDDIQYSVVPLPGAVWMLAPALAGLAVWRRRRYQRTS